MLLDILVLFLGGPDDREAASYAGRLALHPSVNVTLMRILPAYRHGIEVSLSSSSSRASECNFISTEDKGEDADDIFMGHFYSKWVSFRR